MKLGFEKEDIEIKKSNIRHKYDHVNDTWYFSVVDTIGITTKTSDARNYWKVFKNRLNKQANIELVTKCNQLKLPSKDGKSYQTDTLASDDLLELVSIIAPNYIEKFLYFLENIEGKKHSVITSPLSPAPEEGELQTSVSIDMWQNTKILFIRFMAPGIPFQNLKFCFEENDIIITGTRPKQNENDNRDYFKQELFWDNFSRRIKIPIPVEKNNFEIREYKGSYILKFSKIKKSDL